MALLVPNIGELESLRYLVNQNNFVLDREDNAPRDLVLKLYTSDTTPAEADVPSATAYYEPYQNGNTNQYGNTVNTGYPYCVNNRTEARYDYTGQTGILLNGGQWKINQDSTANVVTTATYPEQTFTFAGAAGNVYGYYIVRANNMPLAVQGVADAASGAAATTLTKGDASNVCIGVIGNDYITLPNVASIMDNITLGMSVGGNTAVPAGTLVGGIDRAQRRIYLVDSANAAVALTDNIQGATDPSIELDYTVATAGAAHNLQAGDVIYIARGTSNTTTTEQTYTIFSTPSTTTFTTTPALDGTGNLTLYSSIMFAERFTNGPYPIQNNGDQIKVTLNISLD